MAAIVAIAKTVIVAKPVSRLLAHEILVISCLTCLTNCAGEVFAIKFAVIFFPSLTNFPKRIGYQGIVYTTRVLNFCLNKWRNIIYPLKLQVKKHA